LSGSDDDGVGVGVVSERTLALGVEKSGHGEEASWEIKGEKLKSIKKFIRYTDQKNIE
jgi:hypothetical protein